MWLDLPPARVLRSIEQNVHTTFSFPNPLSESEELQSWGCSEIPLSFLMRFDCHFWPNQQQRHCLPRFESILDGHLSHHLLPAPFHLKINNTTYKHWSVQSLIPISLLTNTNVSIALKQCCMATLCSFPPSTKYKENWLYETSYNSYVFEDRQKKICVWTDFGC